MASIQEIYPLTNNGAILEAFFKDMASSRKSGGKGAISRAGGNSSITSKIWSEIEMLNNSDQTAFFTVAFHHPALHVVLPDCFEAAARSIVSSTKADRIPKAAIQALTEMAIKIITNFDPANIPNSTSSSTSTRNGNGSSAVDMISYCQRLQKLFPPSSWMSLAHVLYRQSPSVATIVLNALLMHMPGDLPSLKAIAMTWCDNVGILYDKCVGEAKRGRFMRTNGDILVLFESAFRLSHELWCLLEAAPIAIAPYLPLDHILDSLSDLTNKISPLLQYFVLHSDDLVSSRGRLSRANALIVNASIRSSVIAMLFTPFIRGSAEESVVSISKGTGYANPRPVQALDESITSQLLESLPLSSVPSRLLKKCGSYSKALKNIVPLFASEGGVAGTTNAKDSSKRQSAGAGRGGNSKRKITADHNVTLFDAGNFRLGETLADLVRDACGGGGGGKNADASKNSSNSNTRFIELVLIELINQGCSISDWVDRELVDEYESSLLGGGGSSSKSQKNQAAPSQQQQRSGGEYSSAPSTAADNTKNNAAAATTRRKGDCYEDEMGELHHVGPNYAGDDDAAFAAAIAASRAEAGLAPEGDVVEDDFIHGSNNTIASESQNLSPAVEMALAVLPHFSPKQIESALAYYNNNIEAFIMDATSDNLPPHLSTAPTSSGAGSSSATKQNATSATVAAAAATSSSPSIFSKAVNSQTNGTFASNGVGKSHHEDEEEDTIPEHLDMFSFLNEIDRVEQQQQQEHHQQQRATVKAGGGGRFTSSYVNYDNNFSAPNDDTDVVGGGLGLGDGMGDVVYSSTAYFGGFGINEMDSDLKHRTVMLAKAQHERLYEDERDDAIDEDDEANRFLAGKIKADESDDEDSEDEGEEGARRGGHVYFGRGDDDGDENMEGNDNENNTFVPAFNNRALGGPMRSGNNGGYQPKYTMKSTTFRVGGDSRNTAGGKDPRDKKKEKKAAGSSAAGAGGGGQSSSASRPEAGNSGGASRGGNGRGPKGAKVNKSNISKLMKAGALF